MRVHSRGYTVLQNDLVLDASLTWEARGMMGYLLSRPPGWILQKSDLIARSPAGREKVERILKELETAGYIIRWQEQGEGGRFLWRSEIFETTAAAAQWQIDNSDHKRVSRSRTINGFPVHGLTVDGSTVDGSTVNGKPVDIVITDLSNPDLVITDLSNTELVSDRAILPSKEIEQGLEVQEPDRPVEVLSDQSSLVPGKTANVPPAPPKNACERQNHALASAARANPDYKRFRAFYERLANVTNSNAGNRADCEWAWERIHAEGFVVNDDFWQGLECFRVQAIAQFKAEGKVIGFKGGKNFLLDREWETAIERARIQGEIEDSGFSPGPKSKTEIQKQKNLETWAKVRKDLEAKGYA